MEKTSGLSYKTKRKALNSNDDESDIYNKIDPYCTTFTQKTSLQEVKLAVFSDNILLKSSGNDDDVHKAIV